MSERFLLWIHQAEYDLKAAVLSHNNMFFEWSCYQCVQAVEKSLKSIIVQAGLRPPKIHKIGVLLGMCNYVNPDFSKIKLNFRYIESFTFVTRYPFVLPGQKQQIPHELISKQDSELLIKLTTEVIDSIKNFLFSYDNKIVNLKDKSILLSLQKQLYSNEEVEKRLDHIVKLIVNVDKRTLNVKKIILFGSFAKNKVQPRTKTIDLLIIGETNLNFFDRISFIRNLTKGGFPIVEPLVYTEKEFKHMIEEEGEGFLETAIEEGILLWSYQNV